MKETERHGHVVPLPGGLLARCGGPAICSVCQEEERELREASLKASGPPEPALASGPYWITGSQWGIYHTYCDCEGITIATKINGPYPTDRTHCPACKERARSEAEYRSLRATCP